MMITKINFLTLAKIAKGIGIDDIADYILFLDSDKDPNEKNSVFTNDNGGITMRYRYTFYESNKEKAFDLMNDLKGILINAGDKSRMIVEHYMGIGENEIRFTIDYTDFDIDYYTVKIVIQF